MKPRFGVLDFFDSPDELADLLLSVQSGCLISSGWKQNDGVNWDKDPDFAWRKEHREAHPCHRELMMVLRGEMNFLHVHRVNPMKSGDVVLCNCMEYHDSMHYPRWINGVVCLWINEFDRQIRVKVCVIKDGETCPIYNMVLQSRTLINLYLKLYSELASDASPDVRVYSNEFFGMLQVFRAVIAREIMLAQKSAHVFDGDWTYQGDCVERAMNYIDSHLAEDTGIELLAKRSGYSVSHFMRIFTAYAGCTVREYRNRSRYNTFCDLRAKKMILKEISLRLGFKSQSAFRHWLVNYRKMMKQRSEEMEAGRLTAMPQ